MLRPWFSLMLERTAVTSVVDSQAGATGAEAKTKELAASKVTEVSSRPIPDATIGFP